MMKLKFNILICVALVAFVLLAAGCEIQRYDDQVGECQVSNGEYEITLYVYADADRVRSKMSMPDEAAEACKVIGAATP